MRTKRTRRRYKKDRYAGIDYEVLQKKIDEEAFLEYAEVYGNFYGTPKEKVFEKLESGRDVLLEIDIQGALKVKKIYKDGVFIFIVPPSMQELKSRLELRGTETRESMINRFESAYREINFVFSYDYVVVNDEVDLATNKLEAIIEAEKCRVHREKNFIEGL